MTETVSTDDHAATDGVRQHAPADVAPELYHPTVGDTGTQDVAVDSTPTRDTTAEDR